MLTTLLYRSADATLTEGGPELIDAWEQDPDSWLWLDLYGEPAEPERDLLQRRFELHPLAIQDAQRDRHPPKIEAFEDYSFLLFKGLSADSDDIDCATIQLALFVGRRFLVTRHSGPSPSIERLRAEVRGGQALPAKGCDALALRLCRLMAQRYLGMLLNVEPRLEVLEREIVDHPRDALLGTLVRHKGDLTRLRRTLHYHRQVATQLRNDGPPGIRADLEHEINDFYEQQERAASLTDLYYELASDLIDGYISVASHRLSQIMRVLTIITAIFVPLSFLAGIYGMNFDNMPELHTRAGYFILMGVMVGLATGLLLLFRKKKWL